MASLTVATDGAERRVMEAFAAPPRRGGRAHLVPGARRRRAPQPGRAGDVTGALHCTEDAVVEPRLALGALRAHLEAAHRAVTASTRAAASSRPRPHALVDAAGTRWEGDVLVLATGAAYDQLPGPSAFGARLRRVRLQMLQTAPFAPPLTTSLADADTLRYYPAYESAPLAAARGADPGGGRAPPAAAAGPAPRRRADHRGHARLRGAVRLRAVRGPDRRARSTGPGGSSGRELPPVQRRWEGVYAQCVDGDVCLREEIEPGVWLVDGPRRPRHDVRAGHRRRHAAGRAGVAA